MNPIRFLVAPVLAFWLFVATVQSSIAASSPRAASFADFDRRAKAGEHLTVVFFGASLTWGANASDPQQTSYRAFAARRFEAAYPRARFHFFDAAIGGTGSLLGVFRLERDVLRRKPDLVFLDFSANDDIYSSDEESLASYESLVRRLVSQARVPVVQVIFPFQWNIKPGEMAKMKRRDAHLQIARAYNTAVGDAIALTTERVQSKQSSLAAIWPFDGVHPGDKGYELFAEAAWQGYQSGVKSKLVCAAPPKMIYADDYLTNERVRLSRFTLPDGWEKGAPNRISAYHDMLMSRWLDDEVIASAGSNPLRLRFRGTSAFLFGEGTPKSGKVRVTLDGKAQEFDAGEMARGAMGNVRFVQTIGQGLDPNIEHELIVEPLLEKDQELRLESLCVAGKNAGVKQDSP